MSVPDNSWALQDNRGHQSITVGNHRITIGHRSDNRPLGTRHTFEVHNSYPAVHKGCPDRSLTVFLRFPTVMLRCPRLSCPKSIPPKCIFPKCIFPKCFFPKCIFPKCIFPKCIFPKCIFSKCIFTKCIFTKCIFPKYFFPKCIFQKCICPKFFL